MSGRVKKHYKTECYTAAWPSGKARDCKSLIQRFESARRLTTRGWLAQLEERMLDVHEAIGSSPIPPNTFVGQIRG